MFSLRPGQPADIPALLPLLAYLFGIEQDFQPDSVKQGKGLDQLMRSPQAHLAVAEAQGKVIGMASLQWVISTAEGAPAGWIEDVVVDPAWQGRGVGGRLLDYLADWARSRGITRLQLLADRDNPPALAFYRAKGWSETSLIALRKPLANR